MLLAQWLVDKSSTMSDPPGDETRPAAAARLVLYMATYVFNCPSTPVPSTGGGADNAVGIVTPAAGGTIVSTNRAPAWTVLADPEGNKVCVCTWQGREAD